ncbi:VOC family protein [Shewanella sp.]|uniref:VOC family protein n=1 Tax=Shewanella sp. TaxID=50422 RepID=UPI003D0E036E
MRVTRYQHGQPCWSELVSSNSEQAKRFYQQLFGWEYLDMPLPQGSYSMSRLHGDDIGAIYPLAPQQQHMPSHWTCYFAVDDVDATINAVQMAGGHLLIGPHDVADAGRMALFTDPEGACFAVWQAGAHPGAKRFDEVNSLCWVELACRSAKTARDFYPQIFGWQVRISSNPDFDYTEWQLGDASLGGMMQMDEQWGDTTPHWMLYFAVEDCDATVATARAMGGDVCVPPTDIPEVGRFAVLKDCTGAVFSVIRLSPVL